MLAGSSGRSPKVNSSAEVTIKALLFYFTAGRKGESPMEYLLSLASLIRNMWKRAHPQVNSARKAPFLLPNAACWLKLDLPGPAMGMVSNYRSISKGHHQSTNGFSLVAPCDSKTLP